MLDLFPDCCVPLIYLPIPVPVLHYLGNSTQWLWIRSDFVPRWSAPHLETLLTVTTGKRYLSFILGSVRNAAKYPTVHRTAPPEQTIIQPQMSVGLSLRNQNSLWYISKSSNTNPLTLFLFFKVVLAILVLRIPVKIFEISLLVSPESLLTFCLRAC